MTPRARPSLDVGLRLLDHQIVGTDDELVGNVDNAVLETLDGVLTLTALVTGPAGFAARFDGRAHRWITSVWIRLRPEADPAPVLIPMTHVTDISSAVTVDDAARQHIADAAQLERWLRRYLVSQIPGASGGPDRLAGDPLEPFGPTSPRRPPGGTGAPPGANLVSDLIGAHVRSGAGESLGTVLDLTTQAPAPGRTRIGALPVRTVLYGRRRLGAQMGYTTQPDQGPWLIAAPMRRWHRDDREVPVDDVDHIDWSERAVVLADTEGAVHPHRS